MIAEKISKGKPGTESEAANRSKSHTYSILSEHNSGLTKTDSDTNRVLSIPSLYRAWDLGVSGASKEHNPAEVRTGTSRTMWNLTQIPIFPPQAHRPSTSHRMTGLDRYSLSC